MHTDTKTMFHLLLHKRGIVAWTFILLMTLAVVTGGDAAAAENAEAKEPSEPITLDILDDDALLLISKTDGRDIVHVLGRSQIQHKDRTIVTDELRYDEENSFAVMDGDVELVDEGEDGLNLTADHLELDLDTEGAFARGNVNFKRKDSRGVADVLRHGEFTALREDIERAIEGRPASTLERILSVLQTFLPEDKVLLLEGDVDLVDGERQFRSELVVINTRDDALVSVGRSAATLPGPDEN